MVPGCLLEPGSQDEHPGQGAQQKLYLGGKETPTRAKVRWETMALPIAHEGLGVTDPKSLLEALLAKFLVRGLAPGGGTMEGTGLAHSRLDETPSPRQVSHPYFVQVWG
jgi:hypothetical protein